MTFQLLYSNLLRTNYEMLELKIKEVAYRYTYDDVHNNLTIGQKLADELTNYSNHFQHEKTALFRISYQIELMITYLTTICVPLSFIIANRERQKLIINLVPQKYRNSIHDFLHPNAVSTSRIFFTVRKSDSSNV